jgi:hypothetical protein
MAGGGYSALDARINSTGIFLLKKMLFSSFPHFLCGLNVTIITNPDKDLVNVERSCRFNALDTNPLFI